MLVVGHRDVDQEVLAAGDDEHAHGVGEPGRPCVAAATSPGVPGLLGAGGPDASDHWHPGLPWAGCSILAAGSAQLSAIREQAIERRLLAADMPASAQATRVYDDYLRELAKTEPGDLAPLAISVIGPRNQVAKLVRRLELLP
jgi:hypothetical protein